MVVAFDDKKERKVNEDFSSSPAKKSGKQRILVTSALPYVNNVPHIGNIVGSHFPADIFARFCRLKGYETLFVGGSDENGTPSEVTALKLGITPKELCDKLYFVHKKIYEWFGISYDIFSRTSSKTHHETTQEFFKKIYENGYVSVGKLKLPYCSKDKMYLPDRYVEGVCPYCGYEKARGDQCEKCTRLLDPEELKNLKCIICGSKPEIREVEHLFLNLDKLSGKLEKWIKSNKHWKEQVRNLALGWIKIGLKPRCITRDLKWGVKVPLKGFEDKIFYVWFDAPIGYVSFVKEYFKEKENPEKWKEFWQNPETKIYHFIGKDNIPFHTVFWPAILIANGEYNLPYQVAGLQYLNYEGDKISKSKGWGVFCEKLPELDINPDLWRFYLTFLIPESKDSEFTWKEFEERINNDLVSNLGNFIHRTLTFLNKYFKGKVPEQGEFNEKDNELIKRIKETPEKVEKLINEIKLRDGLREILVLSSEGNKYFQENEPWKLVKENKERANTVIYLCANLCRSLAILISPYLPLSSEKLWDLLNLSDSEKKWEEASELKLKPNHKIKTPEILFEQLTKEKIDKIKKIATKPTELKEFFK